MEVETMCRYKLPVKIVVLNNGGIGKGVAEDLPDGALNPPHAVTYGARYDLMMAAFGGFGAFVEEPGNFGRRWTRQWRTMGWRWLTSESIPLRAVNHRSLDG